MSSGSRPPDRRSGANALVTSAGEAGFLAFEGIVCLAGFHLKFLAFKSLMLATEINETSKKWHQRRQIRIIRLSPRSLTICSLPEKSIENIEGMGSEFEYFEADRNRSASLRLFIWCKQTRRQRLNEIRAADSQNTAI